MYRITNSHTGRVIADGLKASAVVKFIKSHTRGNVDDRIAEFRKACKKGLEFVFDSKHFWVSHVPVVSNGPLD